MSRGERVGFIFIVCFLLFVWSSSYTAVHIALDSFKPESLALLRFSVASVIMVVLSIFRGIKLPDLKDIPTIIICGFLGISLYHITLNYGQTFVTAGAASMILNSYPIFVAILSGIILKELVSPTRWIGILISFSGIAFIAIGESQGLSLSPGAVFILIGALCLSLFDVIQKKFLKKYSPLQWTSYCIWAGTLLLTFFSFGLADDMGSASANSIMAAVYLGIFPGAVSYLIWSKALSKYSVTAMSTLLYLVPPLTTLVAFFVLKEIPTVISMIGGIIALSGVAVVNFSHKLKMITPLNLSFIRGAYDFVVKSYKSL